MRAIGGGLVALFVACVVGLLCSSCALGLGHPVVPVVGAAPSAPRYTPEQVAVCKKTRTAHDTWAILMGVGGAAGGLTGSASAVSSDHNVQLGVGIGAIALGALSLVSFIGNSITGNTFADNHCNDAIAQP